MVEVELKDAVLSILRDDEQLAYRVGKKDEKLDRMYAVEMERIFHHASSAVFYNFQIGAWTCLPFTCCPPAKKKRVQRLHLVI